MTVVPIDGRRPRARPLPHDLAAEEALLGACLHQPGAVEAAAAVVTPDDFYTPAHGHIFEAVLAVWSRGERADAVTVADQLGGAACDRVGGPALLLRLLGATPSTSNAGRYAELVARHAEHRRLIAVAAEIAEMGYDEADDAWGGAGRLLAGAAPRRQGYGPFTPVPLDLARAPSPPEMLVRGLYGAGCLTVLGAEPGVGKSWVALWWSARLLAQGRSVIYLDAEMGEEDVAGRLRLLGASAEAVAEQLVYVPFPGARWDEGDLRAWRRLVADVAARPCELGLVVVDSLADFLAAAGRDEDRAPEVTAWVAQVVGPVRAAAAGTLLLDHLRKPERGVRQRSRYSRGSGAKLAKADAALLLETAEEFSADHSGSLRLWTTKDRRGRLGVPRLGSEPLVLRVSVASKTVRITEEEPAANGVMAAGPTDCMAAIVALLAGGGELNRRQIGMRVTYRATTVSWALDALLAEGTVRTTAGPKRSTVYQLVDREEPEDAEPLF